MEKQTYTFEEIFDLEALQKLMDALAQAFEVGIGVRTPAGERIIRDSFYLDFCADVMWRTEEGKQSGGLIDAGIKIMIDGMHIATILVGQVLLWLL